MKRLLAGAVMVASVASADAGPLSDALARGDVATLRANLADPATRCTLGAVYIQRNDLSRAALYLAGCTELELPADISPAIAKADRELAKRLRDSDLARIEVVSTPPGMTATTDALPGERFTTPATLYLKAGDYTVKAEANGLVLGNVIHAVKRSRGAVLLEGTGKVIKPQEPATTTIDMSENGGAAEENHTGPPPAQKFKNLMNEKYQRGMTATASAEHNPNALEDPMIVREQRRVSRALWLGIRLGGGMFDDGASKARAGVAVAGVGRFTLANRTFLAARLDWSRRGGEGAIDVLGASAGGGFTLVDTDAIALAVLVQLRSDLRLASARSLAMMDVSVNRAGASAAAGVELALPRTPFTAGLRFEQGLTTLVPGARDRALLFELGVDLR